VWTTCPRLLRSVCPKYRNWTHDVLIASPTLYLLRHRTTAAQWRVQTEEKYKPQPVVVNSRNADHVTTINRWLHFRRLQNTKSMLPASASEINSSTTITHRLCGYLGQLGAFRGCITSATCTKRSLFHQFESENLQSQFPLKPRNSPWENSTSSGIHDIRDHFKDKSVQTKTMLSSGCLELTTKNCSQ